MLTDLSTPRGSFSAVTGAVTITTITREEVHGSFWFTGTCWTAPTVEGTFEALILRDPNAP